MVIFYIIWSLWFLSEILLNRLFRSASYGKKGHDKGTIRIIWITIGIVNTLGIISAVLSDMPISESWFIPYLGLLMIVTGMILRFISIRALGKFFTVDVTIREDHQIKKNGIYRLIRHPSYLGSILSFIGFGISLNNWISLIIISIPVIIAMLKRIRTEEKLLADQFGTEYTDYMKRTSRLIPWIY